MGGGLKTKSRGREEKGAAGCRREEVGRRGSRGAVHLYKPKNLSCVGSCFRRRNVEVVLTARTFSPSSALQMTLRKLCLWRCLGQGLLGNCQGHGGLVEREERVEMEREGEREKPRQNKQ